MTEARPPRFPDSLVLICGLILLAQVATYVLPAGEYERQDNRVVQGTYHTVDTEPLPVLTFLTAVPAGLVAAADVIFFIFIVGGVFGVLRATGAIDALIGLAIRRLGGRPVLAGRRHGDAVRRRVLHGRHGRRVCAVRAAAGGDVSGDQG